MSMFEPTGPLMKTQFLLEKGLEVASLRRKVIANNIANVDVPHFKRSSVSFESQMKRALDSRRKVEEEEALSTTHPAHIPGRRSIDYRSVRPAVHTDTVSTMRNDGNNVDIEEEMMELSRNQMSYNLYIDRLGSNYRMLNSMIRLSM